MVLPGGGALAVPAGHGSRRLVGERGYQRFSRLDRNQQGRSVTRQRHVLKQSGIERFQLGFADIGQLGGLFEIDLGPAGSGPGGGDQESRQAGRGVGKARRTEEEEELQQQEEELQEHQQWRQLPEGAARALQRDRDDEEKKNKQEGVGGGGGGGGNRNPSRAPTAAARNVQYKMRVTFQITWTSQTVVMDGTAEEFSDYVNGNLPTLTEDMIEFGLRSVSEAQEQLHATKLPP